MVGTGARTQHESRVLRRPPLIPIPTDKRLPTFYRDTPSRQCDDLSLLILLHAIDPYVLFL